MAHPAPVSDLPDPSVAELLAARPHLTMHAQDGLVLEGVPLKRIADVVGTPAWVYGAGTMRARLAQLQAALAGTNAHLHYAVKANDHIAVLNLMARGGAGADVTSEGELRRARAGGVAAQDIVFSGVGKTAREIRLAIGEAIGQINVESAAELEVISAIASSMGRTMKVALRINPDVDAGTHAKITTGKADNKFGIAYEDAQAVYARAAELPGVEPVGLALHIGSQILSIAPYRAAYARTADLVRSLRAAGHTVSRVDCGGGLGIGYRDDPGAPVEAFAGAVRATFNNLGVQVMVEPGRWLVGPAGVLLAEVAIAKGTAETRRFLVIDAAMNDLVRPAMYDAYHGIVPLSAADAAAPTELVDIVGPICESSDTFARDRTLPRLAQGARVAILDAGAYGAVMSSTYNTRPLLPIVMVDGDQWAVVRDRQLHEELWAGERIPGFFGT
ncbi:MAG: diaminopimelate decarboxylase [Alphaproteobacteria bacterium]|nr:diaminopimelate decarboxylase [Alphaproteobacteria bacterium]